MNSQFLVTGTSPDDYDDLDDLEPEDTARTSWIEESDELPQSYGRKVQPQLTEPSPDGVPGVDW